MTTPGVGSARQALTAWLAYLTLERRASPRTVRAFSFARFAMMKTARAGLEQFRPPANPF